jgi:hypothetical protein
VESQHELVKIRFETDPGGLGGGSPERLWAKRLSGKSGGFELQNSPFYAKGVSCLDVVETAEDPASPGELIYRRTVFPSAHSTYRILVDKGNESFSGWWAKLAKLGCTYEYSDEGEKLLYAADIPPSANIFEVYGILEAGEKELVWLFDEGHCGQPINRAT